MSNPLTTHASPYMYIGDPVWCCKAPVAVRHAMRHNVSRCAIPPPACCLLPSPPSLLLAFSPSLLPYCLSLLSLHAFLLLPFYIFIPLEMVTIVWQNVVSMSGESKRQSNFNLPLGWCFVYECCFIWFKLSTCKVAVDVISPINGSMFGLTGACYLMAVLGGG